MATQHAAGDTQGMPSVLDGSHGTQQGCGEFFSSWHCATCAATCPSPRQLDRAVTPGPWRVLCSLRWLQGRSRLHCLLPICVRAAVACVYLLDTWRIKRWRRRACSEWRRDPDPSAVAQRASDRAERLPCAASSSSSSCHTTATSTRAVASIA